MLLACAMAGACGNAPHGFGEDGSGGDGGTSGPNGIGPNGGGDGATPDPGASGLPCDVRDLLVAKCDTCHGSTPSQGATTILVTYDDLMKKSPTNPSENEAQVSLAHMKGSIPVMPPAPDVASSSDIATMSNWISAGTPKGTCASGPVTGSDGGVISLPDAAIYDTPTVCTSGTTWTLGDQKSSNMEPGLECHTCHVVGGEASGKEFDISGTVYPTAHEPDDCNGVSGATVIITDAHGGKTSLDVNSVGNFYHDDAVGFFKIATPYTAVVSAGGKTRAMITPQTDGNCNHCHSLTGAESAPGRVTMP